MRASSNGTAGEIIYGYRRRQEQFIPARVKIPGAGVAGITGRPGVRFVSHAAQTPGHPVNARHYLVAKSARRDYARRSGLAIASGEENRIADTRWMPIARRCLPCELPWPS